MSLATCSNSGVIVNIKNLNKINGESEITICMLNKDRLHPRKPVQIVTKVKNLAKGDWLRVSNKNGTPVLEKLHRPILPTEVFENVEGNVKVKCTIVPLSENILNMKQEFVQKGYCIGFSKEFGRILIAFENNLKKDQPYEGWVRTMLDVDENINNAHIFQTLRKKNNAYWVMSPMGFIESSENDRHPLNFSRSPNPQNLDECEVETNLSTESSVTLLVHSRSSSSSPSDRFASDSEDHDDDYDHTNFDANSLPVEDYMEPWNQHNMSPRHQEYDHYQFDEEEDHDDLEDYENIQDNEFENFSETATEALEEVDDDIYIDFPEDAYDKFFIDGEYDKTPTPQKSNSRVMVKVPVPKLRRQTTRINRMEIKSRELNEKEKMEREKKFAQEGHIGIIVGMTKSRDRYFVYSPDFKHEPFLFDEDKYSFARPQICDWIEFIAYKLDDTQIRVIDYNKITPKYITTRHKQTIRMKMELSIPKDYNPDVSKNKVPADFVKEVFDFRSLIKSFYVGKQIVVIIQRQKFFKWTKDGWVGSDAKWSIMQLVSNPHLPPQRRPILQGTSVK